MLSIAVSAGFSSLSSVPGLQVDLSDFGAWTSFSWAVAACGVTILCSLVASQLVTAFFTLSRGAFGAYVGGLGGIGVVYALACGLAADSYSAARDVRQPHLHHHYIGIMLAACARFDRLHSGALLAVGVALLTQGVGAYGFDSLVEPGACRLVTFPRGENLQSWAGMVGCQLPASTSLVVAPVRYRVCPADGVALRISQALVCSAVGRH
jgi:hypothetical protein